MTDWERLGGEEGVRRIVQAQVGRNFEDFVIGFLFQGKDQAHIVQREVELASTHLGGPLRYGGRGMGSAHRPLKINRGQFRRRMAILAHVLREQGVDEAIAARWLEHDRKMEPVITDGTDCLGEADDS